MGLSVKNQNLLGGACKGLDSKQYGLVILFGCKYGNINYFQNNLTKPYRSYEYSGKYDLLNPPPQSKNSLRFSGRQTKKKLISVISIAKKKDHTLILGYPEAGNSPFSMAERASLICNAVSDNIRFVIETFSSSLIQKVRYEIYNKKVDCNKIILLLKPYKDETFQLFTIDENGCYRNSVNQKMKLPTGLFDCCLKEMIEMG